MPDVESWVRGLLASATQTKPSREESGVLVRVCKRLTELLQQGMQQAGIRAKGTQAGVCRKELLE